MFASPTTGTDVDECLLLKLLTVRTAVDEVEGPGKTSSIPGTPIEGSTLMVDDEAEAKCW